MDGLGAISLTLWAKKPEVDNANDCLRVLEGTPGCTQAELQPQWNAINQNIPGNDLTADEKRKLKATVLFEIKAAGLSPKEGPDVWAEFFTAMKDAGCSSIEEMVHVFDSSAELRAAGIPAREIGTCIKIAKALKHVKAELDKLDKKKKKPIRRLDITVQLQAVGLDGLRGAAVTITQDMLDTVLLKSEEKDKPFPYFEVRVFRHYVFSTITRHTSGMGCMWELFGLERRLVRRSERMAWTTVWWMA